MVEKVRVWAGHRPGIRRWTVPPGDCIAVPTTDFYTNRVVELSNEMNELHQRWVALDVYNGPGHDGSVIVNLDEYVAATKEAPTKKPIEVSSEGPGGRRVRATPGWRDWLVAGLVAVTALIIGLIFGGVM